RGPLESGARLDDALAVESKTVECGRARARGDHDVLEVEVTDLFLADLDADPRLAHEPRGPLDDGDPRAFQETRDTVDEAVDRCRPALLELGEVQGAGVGPGEKGEVLARDAAVVEADAADAGALDQRHRASVLSRADRAHVAGGAAAEDENVDRV